MNQALAILNVILAGLCFLGMIFLSTSVSKNTKLQQGLQQQQLTINKGKVTQQVATQIVKDMALISLQDEQIKALLEKYGFTVQVNQNEGN
jgi:hypothetical protein